MVLTHGAGSDCRAPLLVAVADAFCAAGVSVLRCDLAFRQRRPKGPPSPHTAAQDRESLRRAVAALHDIAPADLIVAGHSYGGRQASMLLADEPAMVQRLLLLSYPLHPPDKPGEIRSEHFPRLRVPTIFVHGETDPFATRAELEAAAALIPARTRIIGVEKAGHDLRGGRFDVAALVAAAGDDA
jgi:uncharacterized protein